MSCSAIAWQPQAVCFRAQECPSATLAPSQAGWLAQMLQPALVTAACQLPPQVSWKHRPEYVAARQRFSTLAAGRW